MAIPLIDRLLEEAVATQAAAGVVALAADEGVEHGVITGGSHNPRMGNRAASTRIKEVERRIVAARNPDRGAVALLRRQAVPTGVTGRAGLRNGFGAPDLGPGLGVERDDRNREHYLERRDTDQSSH